MRNSLPILAVVTTAIAMAVLFSGCGNASNGPAIPSETSPRGTVTPTSVDELDVCPTWLPGDHRTFDVSKARERRGSDEDISRESTEEVRIEVTGTDVDETLFTWTFVPGSAAQAGITYQDAKAILAALGEPQAQEALESVQFAAGIPIEIVTDVCGTYLGIQNLDEVHRAYKEAMESLFDLIGDAEGTDESERATLEDFTASYLTPQFIEGILFKYVGPYFDVYGGLFEYDTPQEYEDYGQNPFGGDPFPGIVTYALESLDSGCGVIRKTVVFDPDETRRIMIETFEQLAVEASGEPIAAEDVPIFVINDELETVFCEEDPWVKSVKWIRESTVGEVSQVDRLEMVARD